MLTRDQVLERLNVSPDTLDHLAESLIVLRISGEGGEEYPAIQFSELGLRAYFSSMLGAFRKLKLDGEQIWHVLNSPLGSIGDRTPLEYLAETEDVDKIRLVLSVEADIAAMGDPALQRTDWLKHDGDSGVEDYTPKRRGGQYA